MSDDELVKLIVEADASHARGDFPTRIDAWMYTLRSLETSHRTALAASESALTSLRQSHERAVGLLGQWCAGRECAFTNWQAGKPNPCACTYCSTRAFVAPAPPPTPSPRAGAGHESESCVPCQALLAAVQRDGIKGCVAHGPCPRHAYVVLGVAAPSPPPPTCANDVDMNPKGR